MVFDINFSPSILPSSLFECNSYFFVLFLRNILPLSFDGLVRKSSSILNDLSSDRKNSIRSPYLANIYLIHSLSSFFRNPFDLFRCLDLSLSLSMHRHSPPLTRMVDEGLPCLSHDEKPPCPCKILTLHSNEE